MLTPQPEPGTTTIIKLDREGEDDNWEKQRRFEQVGQDYVRSPQTSCLRDIMC